MLAFGTLWVAGLIERGRSWKREIRRKVLETILMVVQ